MPFAFDKQNNRLYEFRGDKWDLASEEATKKFIQGNVKKQVTPAQVLREESRPFGRALEATTEELQTGLGSIVEPTSILSPVLGGLQALNAPAVGAGTGVGEKVFTSLAGVPGIGPPSGIPAAGGALANAATQLLTGQALFGTGARAVKAGIKGTGELLAPGVLRETGISQASKGLGLPETAVERAFTTPASKSLFEAAERTVGRVDAKAISEPLEAILNLERSRTTKIPEAINRISNLQSEINKAGGITYRGLIEEAQQLGLRARALKETNPNAAKSLNKAREVLLEIGDKVSPATRRANKAYRRELGSEELITALRTTDPANAFRKAIEFNPSISKVFSKAEIGEIDRLAETISEVAKAAPAGMARQMFSAITEPLGQMLASPIGRKALAFSLRLPAKERTAGLVGITQLWRQGLGQRAAQEELQ